VRYLLDTTFVIDVLDGDRIATARLARLYEEGDRIYINEIVVCEAAYGAPSHPDPDLVALVRPLEFIQPGPESALEAGQWRAAARQQGRVLSLADSLIAAAADAAGATILTRNVRDFSLTPVAVEGY
jgi:predicted nucleic acid-binding protein